MKMKLSFTTTIAGIEYPGKLRIEPQHRYIKPSKSFNIYQNWALGFDVKKKSYYTGIVDSLGNFYKLPILTGRVQFSEIQKDTLQTVFFLNQQKKYIKIEFANLRNPIADCESIVNHLNAMRVSDKQILRLKERVDFDEVRCFLDADYQSLINSVQIELYSYGVSEVGKDSRWGKEISITNLPVNDYLQNVISRSAYYKNAHGSLRNSEVIIEIERDSGYVSIGPGRKKLKLDDNIKNEVVSNLQYSFHKFFNHSDFFGTLILKS